MEIKINVSVSAPAMTAEEVVAARKEAIASLTKEVNSARAEFATLAGKLGVKRLYYTPAPGGVSSTEYWISFGVNDSEGLNISRRLGGRDPVDPESLSLSALAGLRAALPFWLREAEHALLAKAIG